MKKTLLDFISRILWWAIHWVDRAYRKYDIPSDAYYHYDYRKSRHKKDKQ